MKKMPSFLSKFITTVILISISAQNIVFAQGFQQEDKTRIGYSDTTGKVSFIGADPSNPITVRSAQVAGLKQESSALAMVSQYAADFGLRNPSNELNLISADQADGRSVTRFQQVYNGVPVMGGEMIVNATNKAELLSLSGEMSPSLSLDTNPSIPPKQALITALELTAKHYQLSKDDLEGSAPELWIYDSRLFEPDGTQPSLVWRLEVKSKNMNIPINELVLVDAIRGNIALNFNQIDTAWNLDEDPPTPLPIQDIPTPTPTPFDLNSSIATETKTPDGTETSSPQLPTLLNEVSPASGTGYYVNIVTGNNSNSCTAIASPCKNIQEAINKAGSGDTVYITSGTYLFSTNGTPNVIIINKNITLSGGWDTSFNSQSGASIIDGANINNGILMISGVATVENFIIQSAKSANSGAIYIVNGNFTLKNSTLRENSAIDKGAGIFIETGTVAVINSTLTGNSAGGSGGGIYASSSNGTSITIQNSTIAYNIAITGGGIVQANSTYTITNSIIANNSASVSGPDCFGTIAAANFNIIKNISGCNITSGGNNLNVDPGIDSNQTTNMFLHSLLIGSPAINAGTSSGCPATDQRGYPRPQGNNCDIGSVEYYGNGTKTIFTLGGKNQTATINTAFVLPLSVLVVDANDLPASNVPVTFTSPASGSSGVFSATGTNTTTITTDVNGVATTSIFTANSIAGTYNINVSASGYNSTAFQMGNTVNARYVSATGTDSGGTTCNSKDSPCLTMNKAIQNALAGDTIYVAAGIYFGSGTEVVLINKNITLSGGWDSTFTTQNGASIIDGQGSRRGITVQYSYPTIVVTSTIDHFTIQNGFHSTQGGGIHIQGGTITLSNSIVSGNVSQWMGGGIYKASGSLTITNTTISGNIAGSGGSGGGGGGIKNNSGTITLNNSLVSGNTIIGGFQGSGINTFGTVTLNNSTVSGNIGGDGVGIYTNSSMFLNNTTITKNRSYGFMIQGNGTITLKNTIVARNGGITDCYNDYPYGGVIISLGYNLIGRGCGFTATTGDIIGSSANPVIPLLTSLQDNGGATQTHALMSGSPAINAGNPAIPGSGGDACLATDQRGISRPVNTRCDIGAYEGSVPFTTIMSINTYTVNNYTDESLLPGTFLCDEAKLSCTNGSNVDADKAHTYAIGTYNFYVSHHNRDSIDNKNMTITSSVDYGFNFQNAFWSGTQMVYGDGFSLADDVVGHELTHGVTQYESNLFYYYQSGAINESFSDIWGELYDQENGLGNDTSGVKWLMGEDLPSGANRSMSNPPAYGDPDKMTSANYFTDSGDNGGVHYNSGINNKAAYLMVDGGTFNGKTVTAIGANKTLAIYYEVQTNLLTSGADYADLYNALYQGCLNLVGGSSGITAGNCQQVRNATDAVEMNLQPVANFNPDAPYSCSDASKIVSFSDNLESGSSNWSFGGSPQRWATSSSYGPFAHSGSGFLYADDYPASITDTYAQITNAIVIPTNGYLTFHHAYDFEQVYYYGLNYNYDGGVVEYSTNGGATWQDASALMDYNGYKGTIYSNWNNPLKGRLAFIGTSHGYVSTRLNLDSLAGQSVKFRWRIGLDDSGSMWGWWLDDIEIYRCDKNSMGGAIITSSQALAGTGRLHLDGQITAYNSDTTGDLNVSVPMLFKNQFGGAYDSALYVQNTSPSNPANITINFFDVFGDFTCAVSDSIPPLSSKSFWLPNVSCLPDPWSGGVNISSSQPISAVARSHIGSELTSYNDFASGSNTMYVPMLFKHQFDGSYDSALYVQNMSPANPANITIKFYDVTGAFSGQMTDTLQPLSATGYWIPNRDILPYVWSGGAVITSDQPIVAIGRPHIGSQVTAYNGFASGSTSINVPMLFKNKPGVGGSYSSAIYVQNVDPLNPATVTLSFYDDDGSFRGSLAGVVLPSFSSTGFWLPFRDFLPDDWSGSAVLTSDHPIVALGRLHVNNEIMTYNGSAGSSSMYVPMLFEDDFNGSNYDSALFLQNTQNSPASVTVKLYKNDGSLQCTYSQSINPYASANFWLEDLTCP
ncbi:MAG: choice-of-anchor Q domain-containing protein [Anaerolineales bacterium]